MSAAGPRRAGPSSRVRAAFAEDPVRSSRISNRKLSVTPANSQAVAVVVATDSRAAQWDAFVGRAEGATLSHLFGWRQVLQRAYRKKCIYLYAERAREIAAVLPLVQMRAPFGAMRLVSMPFLDLGGIVADSSEAVEALRREALRVARESGASGIELRGGGFVVETDAGEPTRYRFLLSIPEARDELWSKIGPKVRNQVRKSEKAGLTTMSVEPSRLPDFYAIFARNMRDLGSPVHSRRLFSEIFRVFESRASLYLTVDAADSPVAGAIALRFGDSLTVPWASSLQSARSACPNHSLYWRILSDAHEQGIRVFDFGRSTVGTGTFHFKKQWRAEAVPLRWFSVDRSGDPRRIVHLSSRRNRHLARTWRLLPVPLANLLGPWIRGRLAN